MSDLKRLRPYFGSATMHASNGEGICDTDSDA